MDTAFSASYSPAAARAITEDVPSARRYAPPGDPARPLDPVFPGVPKPTDNPDLPPVEPSPPEIEDPPPDVVPTPVRDPPVMPPPNGRRAAVMHPVMR